MRTATLELAVEAWSTGTIAGTIADPPLGNKFGIRSASYGMTVLSGNNTYTGVTRILRGVLSLGSIGNGGVPSNVGASSSAASNFYFEAQGTLHYTGSTASTNRNIGMYGGAQTAIIDVANDTTTLTISGAFTATGGGGTSWALFKTGPGTLALAGTNLYTGTTYLRAGTLRLDYATVGSTDVLADAARCVSVEPRAAERLTSRGGPAPKS